MAGNVQFILGRAGTGKSRLIQDRIVPLLREDPLGPPIYLVVPAQATFAHERHYALGAGIEGYARLRVVSFEMLGEDVIAECGGEAMVQVTHVGRQMLLGHLLRTHADQLGYFKGVARQLGLVAELDRTFAELDRAGHGADEQLEALEAQLSEEAGPELDALVAKSRDLAVLGKAYRKALGQDRLDATRRLEHVMKNLDGCRTLRQSRIYVDGFYRFSAFERKLLAKLADLVQEMSIALTLDPREIERTLDPKYKVDETDLFSQTVSTYRHLVLEFEKAKLALAKPIALNEPRRFHSPALAAIEQDWSRPRPSQRPGIDASAVTLIEAPDPRSEADAAARQVRQWTTTGFRLRDIVVLCRDLSVMQPLLEASFREHVLPFFTDRRRPAAHHPLARLVRALLRIATRNWPQDDVIDLCKCGLAGMSLDDADALQNYVLEHRIRGRTAWTRSEPWRYHTQEPEEAAADDEGTPVPVDEKPDRIDQLRRKLADAIAPLHEVLHKEHPAREHLAALWKCLDAFDVGKRLATQIAAATEAEDLEQAAEHQQAWEELVALSEQALELLGDVNISGEDFTATLEYGLDLLDLAIIPPRADEVVIGDVERTRTLGCRAAVVLGLNDGTFPRSHGEPGVLSDDERRILQERNVDVEPDGRSLQLTERFLAYRAFAAPSERLVLTRSSADAQGRPAAPSPFWTHVQKLLDVAVLKLPPEAADEPGCIGTPRQLAAAIMRWARAQGKTKGVATAGARPDLATLYHFIAEHRDLEGPMGRMRRLAWPALSYENDAALRPETAQRIWKDGVLFTSVSRLENFAACPFRHYAGHVLKLHSRDDDEDVSARDLGTVYHGVLERLVRHCISQKLAFSDAGAISDQNIAQMTREIGASIRGRIMLSNARNQYLLKRIETTLKGVIAGQQAVLRRGSMSPLATELKFGEGEDANVPPLELQTPRGRRVRLYGQIDRVDYSPATGHAAVIDYKLGGKVLKLDEVTYGLSLQLLLYLLVLERNGASLADPPPKPAAALYVKLLRGIESAKHPGDPDKEDPEVLDLRVKPRGLIDREALAELDGTYQPGSRCQTYSIRVRGDDEIGGGQGNDLVESSDFRALLDEVEHQVVRLADELIDGEIRIRPYKMGTTTPCPNCDFRSFCRFDPATDSYAVMEPKTRAEVLDRLRAKREGP